jgi:redox-sensing transcriptional repressor
VAVFDNDPEKVGEPIGPDGRLVIQPFSQVRQVVREQDIQVAIISVPAEVAQSVADELVSAGIKGILNFAPASLTVPESIPIASVDLAVHLEQLAFRISANQLAAQ